jgi:hypothetical protein
MKREITSKSYRLTMTIIYVAQASVLVFISIAVLLLNASGGLNPVEYLTHIFYYLVPIATVVFLAMGHFIFKTLLSKIDATMTLRQKLPKYQNALLIRSALLELPGLLGAVAAMLTGEMYFLVATLLILIIFVMLRPTLYSIVEDLGLSGEEKALVENPEAVVSKIEG